MAMQQAFGLSLGLRIAVIRAYRDGRDVSSVIMPQIQAVRPTVIDAMTAAHLYGRARAKLLADGAPIRLGHDELWDGLALGRVRNALQAAIAFIQDKLNLTTAKVRQLASQYGSAATSATNQLGSEVERKVLAAVADVTRKGLHVRDGVKAIGKAFDAAGVVPGNSFAVEGLMRTQTALAYNAGRLNADRDPAIQEILAGYIFNTVGDDRVRPTHAAMDGVRRPKDDPIWRVWSPPCGYNCRCTLIPYYFDEKLKPTRVPETTKDEHGNRVQVKPDDGWAFNPAQLFRDTLDI